GGPRAQVTVAELLQGVGEPRRTRSRRWLIASTHAQVLLATRSHRDRPARPSLRALSTGWLVQQPVPCGRRHAHRLRRTDCLRPPRSLAERTRSPAHGPTAGDVGSERLRVRAGRPYRAVLVRPRHHPRRLGFQTSLRARGTQLAERVWLLG